jgi:hypothetical protein
MASLLLLLSNGLIFSDTGVSDSEKNVLSVLIILAFVILCVLAVVTVLKEIILLKCGKKSIRVKAKVIDSAAPSTTSIAGAQDIATTAIPMTSPGANDPNYSQPNSNTQ